MATPTPPGDWYDPYSDEKKLLTLQEAVAEKARWSDPRAAFINAAARGQILWRQRNP